MWEPVITRLFTLDQEQGPGIISEIWAFEPVHHGDSAWLNRDSGMEGAFSVNL